MVRSWVVLAVLTFATAFGQSKIPGGGTAGTAAGPTRSSAESDTAPTNDLHIKSVDQVLHDDPKLSAKLQDMLPADLTPQQACSGFKTLEQCVTAIHVAQNLKLPFADLKAKTTGKGSIGLQKAIAEMAATANAKDELKKAKKQTADDMKGISLFGTLSPQEEMVPLSRPIPG